MKDYGLVSIITANFNCGQLLGKTIQSVLSQTYPYWELLVQDDCSTDGSTEEILEFANQDKRILFEKNLTNQGAALTRNAALIRAKGKWIAFLDSDDLWEPQKLEKQVLFMVENGHKFSYTSYQEMDAGGSLTGIIVSGPRHITQAGMFAFCWPGCLTVMYDREAIGLIQIEDIKKNNDYAMWLKVCKQADCYLLPEVLAKYRRGRSGSVSSHSISTMIKWHYKLFREAEKLGVVSSLWHTGINLVCGFYKKKKYVTKV